MRIVCATLIILAFIPVASHAQETTVDDAKKALSRAKDALEEFVVFRAQEDGGGAFLKSEHDRAEHLRELEKRAVRAGDARENAAKYDLAKRLQTYPEKYTEEAFQAFVAYVGFVKTYREFEEHVKQDETFNEKAARIIDELDVLIDRHGRGLRVASLRLLYEDESVGKVGAFNLRGKRRTVKIDGETADLYRLRTLKGTAVLLKQENAKERKRFILAEIVGKGAYTTDAGEKIQAFLLQAY